MVASGPERLGSARLERRPCRAPAASGGLGRCGSRHGGQAGAVGAEDPDLFADGLVRATTQLGPVDVGGGLWGGAQPGASRLDAGPHLSAPLRVGGVNLRLMGEWRFRLAGDAAPGSGPAFTLASDF
ncbi:MAG: hypothetical protein ACK4SZ_05515 [Allosphingosinicella sp.]|uniref:hypothetical protein n=1 Tax=Allosphingosinicella sp. TaxID=2823234 RepID=UPI00394367D2